MAIKRSNYTLSEHALRAKLLHPNAWHKTSSNVYIVEDDGFGLLGIHDAETMEELSLYENNKRHRRWRYPVR